MKDWMPGDKVVCVNNRPPGGRSFFARRNGVWNHLKKGEVYVLSAVEISLYRGMGGETDIFVDVEGIPRVISNGLLSGPNFYSTRFRKLNTPDKAEGNKADFKLLLEQHKSKPAKAPTKVPVPAKTVPLLPSPPEE